MPPQAAGNTTEVLRAADVILDGVRQPGRWQEGGMWIRGLCEDCNNQAGSHYDVAYADFASQVGRLSSPLARHLAVVPGEAPAVRFAPGLVARAVVFGMFAVNPRLRILFPNLAADLMAEMKHGHTGAGPVRWPDKLRLKVGRTHPVFPNTGVISSGVWAMRVETERVVHGTFGDIVWPPLTWSLVPVLDSTESDGLGPPITMQLADASDWIHYGPDRTAVDLRHLVRALPAMLHPMLARTDDWIELMSNDGSDADAVVVFGRQP